MKEPNFKKVKMLTTKLEDDIDSLVKSYGEKSKWVIEKKEILQTLVDFHDQCVDYKIQSDNLVDMSAVNIETYRLIQYKMEYNMPWKKVFASMGKKEPLVFDLLENATSFLNSVDDFKDEKLLNKFLLQLLTETT
jgi:hypothetical protein